MSKLLSADLEFDSRKVRISDRVLFEANSEAEIQKVETNGRDRIFILVRGKSSQSQTNVLALDPNGQIVWRAKDRPGEYDDELVDFLYKEPLLQAWSWNYVYEFEGRSGELVRQEINK